MTDLLVIALTNLLMAAVLAMVAFAVGRLSRNPALAHALWLLVLIKLITPPLIRVPIPLPLSQEVPAMHVVAEATTSDQMVPTEPCPAPYVSPPLEDAWQTNAGVIDPAQAMQTEPEADIEVAQQISPPVPPPATEAPSNVAALPPLLWFQVAAAGLWLIGAGLLFFVTARRIRQFQLFLRHAAPADRELQQRAAALAGKMGVRCPSVWMVPGIVSPMLWSIGSTRRLLLPHDLLERLNEAQQSTLLAHELAHLRRGDHWVRYLEIVVLCLYWWCPLVWWARRELHAAEEECCDAWVVWVLPHLARDYALALVETLDFLCEVKTAAPALASGIRPIPLLRRRLTMIMRGSSPRLLTAVGGLALLALAAVLLPLLPIIAQEEKPSREPPRKENDFTRPPAGGPEVQRLQEQLEKLHQQRKELDHQLAELQRALGNLRREPGDKERPDPNGKPEPKPKPFTPDRKYEGSPRPFSPDRKPGEGPGAFGPDRKPGEGPGAFGPDRKPGATPGAFGPGQGPIDRRLEELERKMERLMEMVEGLRRSMDDRPFPPRNFGPKGPPTGAKERDDNRPAPPEDRRPGGEARPERPEFRQPIDPRREIQEERKSP